MTYTHVNSECSEPVHGPTCYDDNGHESQLSPSNIQQEALPAPDLVRLMAFRNEAVGMVPWPRAMPSSRLRRMPTPMAMAPERSVVRVRRSPALTSDDNQRCRPLLGLVAARISARQNSSPSSDLTVSLQAEWNRGIPAMPQQVASRRRSSTNVPNTLQWLGRARHDDGTIAVAIPPSSHAMPSAPTQNR